MDGTVLSGLLVLAALLVLLVIGSWRGPARWSGSPQDPPNRRTLERPAQPELDVQLPYAHLDDVTEAPSPADRPSPPLVTMPAAIPAAPRALPPRRRDGVTRILLVDPESGPTATLRTLVVAGFEVLRAADGHEALAVYRSAEPPVDLVVAEAYAPGMTGAELAGRLRALNPELGVVLLTAFPAEVVRAPACVRVVSGGVDPHALLASIADGLRDPSPAADEFSTRAES